MTEHYIILKPKSPLINEIFIVLIQEFESPELSDDRSGNILRDRNFGNSKLIVLGIYILVCHKNKATSSPGSLTSTQRHPGIQHVQGLHQPVAPIHFLSQGMLGLASGNCSRVELGQPDQTLKDFTDQAVARVEVTAELV